MIIIIHPNNYKPNGFDLLYSITLIILYELFDLLELQQIVLLFHYYYSEFHD